MLGFFCHTGFLKCAQFTVFCAAFHGNEWGFSVTLPVLLHLQVSFFLFIIFVVYTMLPFNMRDAIIASVLTSSSHTIVLSVCLSATPGAKEHLVWQVGDLPHPAGDA